MHSWHWWDHYERKLEQYVLFTEHQTIHRYKRFHKKYMSLMGGNEKTILKLEKYLKKMTVVMYPHLFKGREDDS